jgi:hypothetical protein
MMALVYEGYFNDEEALGKFGSHGGCNMRPKERSLRSGKPHRAHIPGSLVQIQPPLSTLNNLDAG